MQIEAADALILNKIDLVSSDELNAIEEKLYSLNEVASILRTERGQVDTDLLFGIARERVQAPPDHIHQPEFDSFSYTSEATFNRQCFEEFADSLGTDVYRAKGFIRFPDGIYLFNFVTGRWDFEVFEQEATELVFIGKQVNQRKEEIIGRLKLCEQ
ncbi:MAG TPA: GTP-binding protein, partial [Coleofasciculaceae cyanobacterium]